jgi:preprotein translocase subunit SecA
MTGTAASEELNSIYGLDVIEIPNLPSCAPMRTTGSTTVEENTERSFRIEPPTRRTSRFWSAPLHRKSEQLAERLRKEGMKDFQVLNAIRAGSHRRSGGVPGR